MVHRRGDARNILVAVILLAVLQAAAAKSIIVGGDSQQWNKPPVGEPYFYDDWAAEQSIFVGDELIFMYVAGDHDVSAVGASYYESCSIDPNGITLSTGDDVYTILEAGTYYFICLVADHCAAGMSMTITVSDPSPPPPPVYVTPAPPPTAYVTPAPVPESGVTPTNAPPTSRPPPPNNPPPPNYRPRSPAVTHPVKHKSAVGLIGGVIGGLLAATLVVGLLVFCCRKRCSCFGKQEPNKTVQIEVEDGAPRSFTYRELSASTKNFSGSELLSSGGFGDVFKGTLPSGAVVAVKRIRPNQTKGEESFVAEATSLGHIRHRNLLRLRGWCQAKEGLMLVYDFMCNGSLDQWIYQTTDADSANGDHPSLGVADPGLPWKLRLSILAGVSSGLVYLHEEWEQCILHRDIKASNVLLDANFNACLGDFGLARLVDHAVMQKTTLMAGTLGYMAPEMQYTGRASIETDVYAFGILSLEVVCGKRALGSVAVGDSMEHYVLVESVWQAHEAGNILSEADPGLWSHGDVDHPDYRDGIDSAAVGKVLELGLLCCLPSPAERPSMRFVHQWFQSGLVQELPRLPASKPSVARRASSRSDSSFSQAKQPASL